MSQYAGKLRRRRLIEIHYIPEENTAVKEIKDKRIKNPIHTTVGRGPPLIDFLMDAFKISGS